MSSFATYPALYGMNRRTPTRFAPAPVANPASSATYGAANALGPAPAAAPPAPAPSAPLYGRSVGAKPAAPVALNAPKPVQGGVMGRVSGASDPAWMVDALKPRPLPNTMSIGTPGDPVRNWYGNNKPIQSLTPPAKTAPSNLYGVRPAPPRQPAAQPQAPAQVPAAAPQALPPQAIAQPMAQTQAPAVQPATSYPPQPSPVAQGPAAAAPAASPGGWTSQIAGGPGNPSPNPPTPANLAQTGNPRIDAMIASQQQQQAQANAANQQRYNELLRLNDQGGAGQLADQTTTLGGLQNTINSGQANKLGYLGNQQDYLNNMLGGQSQSQLGFLDAQHGVETGLASQYGNAEKAQEALNLKNQLGALNQYAINSGLNTTSAPLAGIGAAYNDSAIRTQQIDEALANRMLGVEQGYTGQRYGAMSNLGSQALGLNQNFANQGYGAVNDANQQAFSTEAAYGSQRANTLADLQNQRSGIIERRTDQGPDISMTANLLSQARGGSMLPYYGIGNTRYGFGGGYGGSLMPRGYSQGGGFNAADRNSGSAGMGGFGAIGGPAGGAFLSGTPTGSAYYGQSGMGNSTPAQPGGSPGGYQEGQYYPVPQQYAANNPGYAAMTTRDGIQYLVTQDGQLVPVS